MSLTHALKKFLINPPSQSGLIYDLGAMSSLAAATKVELGKQELLIAVKSFPASEGLARILPEISGADISNYNEFCLIRESASKNKSSLWLTRCPLGDLRKILSENSGCEIWYNTDITSDLPELVRLKTSHDFRISLRINSSSMVPLNHPQFLNSRFGIRTAELAQAMKEYGHVIEGLHLHHGGEKNDLLLFRLFLNHMNKLHDQYPSVKKFNLGGGWDLRDKEIISEIRNSKLDLAVEPGRFFGTGCGFAFTTISVIRKIDSWTYLEGSLSPECSFKWSREISQTIIPLGSEKQEFTGALYYGSQNCDESDRLQISTHGKKTVGVGDLILFSGISTYSLAWNHSFNGIATPVYFLG